MSFSHEKKENPVFVTTRMDLEDIMLSEISHTENDEYCINHLHVESKKPEVKL